MPNVKDIRIELRVDEQTVEEIDMWRKEHHQLDLSRSEAIRLMIKKCTRDEYNLTIAERLQLMLSSEILKAVAPHNNLVDVKSLNNFIDALSSGHDWAIKEIMPGVITETDKTDDVEFVYSVLNMFRIIKFSLNEIQDNSDLSNKLKFKGFDNNEEPEFHSICLFILYHLEKYRELQDKSIQDGAMMPMVKQYVKMLEKYQKIYKGELLTKDELTSLLI